MNKTWRWIKILLIILIVIGLIPWDRWFDADKRTNWWSYGSVLWNLFYRKDNGDLTSWRIILPGYGWQWWNLGRYVPTLWLDFDVFDDNEFSISIRGMSKKNRCAHSCSFGWSNIDGWFYYHCDV